MKFNCEICDYHTEDKSNFVKHEKSYKHGKKAKGESTKKVFKCKFCGYSTPLLLNWERHLGLKHFKETYSNIMGLRAEIKRLLNNATIIRNRDPEKADDYETHAEELKLDLEYESDMHKLVRDYMQQHIPEALNKAKSEISKNQSRRKYDGYHRK